MSFPVPTRQTEAIRLGFNEATFALVAVAVLLTGAVFWAAHGPLTEKTDFSLMYVGARIVHQREGAQLYDLEKQSEVRDSLFEHPNPLIFEHPPFEALLLAPLAALPYRTAYMVWGFLNVLIWVALPVLLRPHLAVPQEALGYFGLWVIFAPLGVALFQGQSSIFLLLLYSISFLHLKREHDLQAGFWLGLGLFKFQFVLPFALIFLLRAKWRFLAGFAVSAALLGALSLLAVGPNGVFNYIRLLLAVGRAPDNLSYGSAVDMPTLHGFIYAVLGRVLSVHRIAAIVAAGSVFLILFTVRAWQRLTPPVAEASFDLMFAGALAVALMTGSHMFTHDFSPLMLALLLACNHFRENRQVALRWALGITLLVFWIPPVYLALVSWHCLYLMFPVLLIFALIVIAQANFTAGEAKPEQGHVSA